MNLFDALESLELPIGDYAVFGSGPLIVRGIIEAANDLEIISRGSAWERACEVGEIRYVAEYGVDIVHSFDDTITIGYSWGYGSFDFDGLIDTAELIDGLPFVRLEHVVAYKEIAGRPKDLDDLLRHEAANLAG